MSLFTVPSGCKFYPTVAELLVRQQQPLQKQLVILPKKVDIPRLTQALGELRNGRTLLPKMQVSGEDPLLSLGLPKQLDRQTYRLLFAQILSELTQRSYDQSLLLASNFIQVLDQLQKHRPNWFSDPKVAAIFQENSLLKLLNSAWQRWLTLANAEGFIDPQGHQNLVLEQQIATFSQQPTTHITIAGLVEPSWFVSQLAKVIHAGGGKVILPHLDTESSAVIWKEIGASPSHPQHQNYLWLRSLAVTREQVTSLAEQRMATSEPPQDFLRCAFLPVQTVQQAKKSLPPSADIPKYIDCENEAEEARIIALLLGEAAANPASKAVLITDNQELAQRVRLDAQRWNLTVSHKNGTSLASTAAGLVTIQVLRLVTEKPSCATFFDLVKNPLSVKLLDRDLRTELSHCEKRMRFDAHQVPKLEKLGYYDPHQLTVRQQRRINHWGKNFLACWRQARLLLRNQEVDLAELLEWQLRLSRLVTGGREQQSGSLWTGDAGKKLTETFNWVQAATKYLTKVNPQQWLKAWQSLLAGQKVHVQSATSEQLTIVSEAEAFLLDADRYLIADCNHQAMPRVSKIHWFNDQLASRLGLPTTEEKKGLALQRIVSWLAQKEVFLTRAQKVAGTVTAPSPWLQRLNSYVQQFGLSLEERKYHSWLPYLVSQQAPPAVPSAPTWNSRDQLPQLSASAIEKLFNNPYVFYASALLKLRPLPEFSTHFGANQFGTFCHQVLSVLGSKRGDNLLSSCKQTAISLAKEAQEDPVQRCILLAQFDNLADHLASHILPRSGFGQVKECEKTGTWTFVLDEKQPANKLTLVCKADRIDQVAENRFRIVDYKLKNLPSKKEVASFRKPQLLVEGLILQQGGFGKRKVSDRYSPRVTQVIYVKINPDQLKCHEEWAKCSKCCVEPCSDNLDEQLSRFELALKEKLQEYFVDGRPFTADFTRASNFLSNSDDLYRQLARQV